MVGAVLEVKCGDDCLRTVRGGGLQSPTHSLTRSVCYCVGIGPRRNAREGGRKSKCVIAVF